MVETGPALELWKGGKYLVGTKFEYLGCRSGLFPSLIFPCTVVSFNVKYHVEGKTGRWWSCVKKTDIVSSLVRKAQPEDEKGWRRETALVPSTAVT